MNLLDLLPIGAIVVSGCAILINRSSRLRAWLTQRNGIRGRGLVNLVLDGIFITWAFYFISTGTLIPGSLTRAPEHARPVVSSDSHEPAILPELPSYSPVEPAPADETV